MEVHLYTLTKTNYLIALAYSFGLAGGCKECNISIQIFKNSAVRLEKFQGMLKLIKLNGIISFMCS